MAKTFVARIAPVDAQFPAGTPAQGGFLWTLSGPVPQSQTTPGPEATFTVDPGEWVLVCQVIDVNGGPLGGPSRPAAFTVTEDTVTVQIVTDGEISITF
jgi:hypothetical protein